MNFTFKVDPRRVREHQETLLRTTERFFDGPIPEAIRAAFIATPRHAFAPRFYSSKQRRWVELAVESADDHLAEIYDDHPLGISRDEHGRTLATISQPSLVLYMLDLLDLGPGMNVFELGGGSGWNAAMMGRLVGPKGHVTSVEILEPLAQTAQKAMAEFGLPQVEIIAGDGSRGLSNRAPFDRGVFTASAWELPLEFFDQIAPQGLLLLVLKLRPGYDLLASLRRGRERRFDSELHFPCAFVPVTGAGYRDGGEPILVSEMDELRTDGDSKPKDIPWRDLKLSGADIPAFIAFAETVFDCNRSFLVENAGIDHPEEFSGVRRGAHSLALFNDDRVCQIGSDESLVELRRAAKRWLKAGRPKLEDLALSILPADAAPEEKSDQWIVRRGDVVLVWSI